MGWKPVPYPKNRKSREWGLYMLARRGAKRRARPIIPPGTRRQQEQRAQRAQAHDAADVSLLKTPRDA